MNNDNSDMQEQVNTLERTILELASEVYQIRRSHDEIQSTYKALGQKISYIFEALENKNLLSSEDLQEIIEKNQENTAQEEAIEKKYNH